MWFISRVMPSNTCLNIKMMLVGGSLLSTLILAGCTPSTEESSKDNSLTDNPYTQQAVNGSTAATPSNPDQDQDQDEDGITVTDGAQQIMDDTLVEPKVWQPNVSQQFIGMSEHDQRLASALPEIPYNFDNLSDKAVAVNSAVWTPDAPLDEALVIKIQALLNYNHHSIGAVDGRYGKNVIKAIEVFQESHDLEPTGTMTPETWDLLTRDRTLASQPVLVNYQLTVADVTLDHNPKGQQFRSVLEAMGEKFHMSQGLILRLNPNTELKAGNTILVYNPYQPNTTPVYRVVANKQKNLLYAYDINDELVASYPTSMGSSYKPSPNGEYKVISRIKNPTYNHDFKNEKSVLPPGPNNPVGRVWIAINKPSYGIHGSPDPEKISRQHSSGCVRLTNWDALGLYGTIEEGAKVEFL